MYVCIQNACAQDVDADLRKLTRADVQRVFDDDDDEDNVDDDGAVVGRWQWKEGDSCLQVVLHCCCTLWVVPRERRREDRRTYVGIQQEEEVEDHRRVSQFNCDR